MTETVREFIERIDRLEKRFKHDRFADAYLMPRELMVRLRDELKEPTLFETKPCTN